MSDEIGNVKIETWQFLLTDELYGAFGLDSGHGSINILGHNIPTVHEAAGHILSMTRITLGHHTSRLKDGVGNLSHRELFMVSLLGRDDGCI